MRLLKTAIQNLRATKIRTFLSMLGILVGTASVVALLSIGQIAMEASLVELKKLGTNILSIQLSNKSALSPVFTLKNALQIKNASPDIDEIAPYQSPYATVVYRGNALDASVIGVTENLATILNIPMLYGRFISQYDNRQMFCVMGNAIFQNLNLPKDVVLGSRITVGNDRYVIVGITDTVPQNSFVYIDINKSILVPIKTVDLFAKLDINSIIVKLLPNVQDMTTQKEKMESYLANVVVDKNIQIQTPEELLKSARAQTHIFLIFLGSIGGITLMVGGIGIMTIMLISVRERRREIGIRVAVGAHRADIQSMFLMESVITSMIGGIIGIITGLIVTLFVSILSGWPFQFYVLPIIIGFASSMIAGVFFGFYPAYKAAKLQPIETLRAE